MSTALSLDTLRGDDGTLRLIASGEIDMSNIDAFDHALAAATEDVGNGETVVVDLGAVEYLDSGAINAMISRADRITLIAHPLLMTALVVSGLTQLVATESASTHAEL